MSLLCDNSCGFENVSGMFQDISGPDPTAIFAVLFFVSIFRHAEDGSITPDAFRTHFRSHKIWDTDLKNIGEWLDSLASGIVSCAAKESTKAGFGDIRGNLLRPALLYSRRPGHSHHGFP